MSLMMCGRLVKASGRRTKKDATKIMYSYFVQGEDGAVRECLTMTPYPAKGGDNVMIPVDASVRRDNAGKPTDAVTLWIAGDASQGDSDVVVPGFEDDLDLSKLPKSENHKQSVA